MALRFLEIPQLSPGIFKHILGIRLMIPSDYFLDVLLSHLILDSEEEKKTKKGTKETDAATVKKHPVTYMSDSGEGVNKQISTCVI